MNDPLEVRIERPIQATSKDSLHSRRVYGRRKSLGEQIRSSSHGRTKVIPSSSTGAPCEQNAECGTRSVEWSREIKNKNQAMIPKLGCATRPIGGCPSGFGGYTIPCAAANPGALCGLSIDGGGNAPCSLIFGGQSMSWAQLASIRVVSSATWVPWSSQSNPPIFKITTGYWSLSESQIGTGADLAIAANNGTSNCISPGVCKSPIDNLNLMEIGKTNYRDPFSICSTHTTVDNSTGATSSHVDLFNPGTSIPTGPITGNVPALPFHLLFDALPDAIYRVTGQYLLPAGRGLCQ